jgi:hypothetical protein
MKPDRRGYDHEQSNRFTGEIAEENARNAGRKVEEDAG